jgi:hypothetical protein
VEAKLEKLLNACIRYIYNLNKRDHISEFYVKLKWPRIEERREFHLLCYMYKIIHTYQPPYLKTMVTLMSTVHSRVTRSHPFYLQIPNCKVECFSLKGARIWNKISKDLCCSSSYNIFKFNLYNTFV